MTTHDSTDPESIFAAWADAVARGERADFAQLLERHPEHAAALERIHSDLELFEGRRARVVPSSLGETSLPHEVSPGPDGSHPSVLDALRTRAGCGLGVHLETDSAEVGAVPVRVTAAAKELRSSGGRYQVLGELGQGGVGIVYRGRDYDLGRDVALKFLKDQHVDRPEILARFVEEAQIGGQLQHPGIVPVYELGLLAGKRPYFAMKLVKGETLAEQLARGASALDRRQLLRVFEQVCQTVAYAHARRVVHRDLKPGNVMIGSFGEVQVLDWGFAKVLERKEAPSPTPAAGAKQPSLVETVRSAPGAAQSTPGSVLGTPAYMSPEQAQGRLERVDERSDVFSLGAMLCEILTGAPPYRAEDGDLLELAQEGDVGPALERLRSCGAADELVALCTDCLASSPRARPATAEVVAERIGGYLASLEQRARLAEVRVAEARYRQRTTLLGAAAAFGVLSLGVGGWAWIESQARARRSQAEERVGRATASASDARAKALASALDLGLWEAAATSAEYAVRMARDEDVGDHAGEQAEGLLARVATERSAAERECERRNRDADMVEGLETLRVTVDEDNELDWADWEPKELRRLDDGYAKAFQRYMEGALLERTVEDQLESLRDGDIELELAASLDHWGLVRDGLGDGMPDPEETARIRELAAGLDGGDPWRSELRRLLPRAVVETDRLRDLAQNANYGELTPSATRVLSEALWAGKAREWSVDVLRQGRAHHPSDFDLCFRLALRLALLGGEHREEALAVLRIAEALRPKRSEVLHQQGLMLFALKRHDDEKHVFRRLVNREPERAHWWFHLAGAQDELGEKEEAIDAYEYAVELDPSDIDSHVNLGNVLQDTGRVVEAIARYDVALALAPEDAGALNARGVALKKTGSLDQSIESLERALALDGKNVMIHHNLGTALFMKGRKEEAIAIFRRAVAIDPSSGVGHRHVGAALVDVNDLEAGIQHLHRALELDPADALIHFNLGLALSAKNLLDDAIAHHGRALELDPQMEVAHHQLGKILVRQGKHQEAIESYARALELDPSCVEAHVDLGDSLAELERYGEALESYERALGIDPGRCLAHNGIGLVLQALGKLDEAVARYGRLLEFEPTCRAALINRGNALTDQGRTTEALESYQRALANDPRDIDALYCIGSTLVAQGRTEEGLARFEQALQIDPQHAGALRGLGTGLFHAGRYDDAVAHFRRWTELVPASSYAHAMLGLSLWNVSSVEESVTSYERALTLDPDDATTHANLGGALASLGRYSEALSSCERAISIDEHYAPAHFNRAAALQDSGRLQDAIEAFRRAEELYAKDDVAQAQVARTRIETLERRIARIPELDAVLTGARTAASNREWSEAIRHGYGADRHADVVALTERTLQDRPDLVDGNVETWGAYNSACSAALLAANAEAELDHAERTRLRGLAHAWLQREVARWREQSAANGPDAAAGRQRLAHALGDPDFVTLRAAALSQLPSDEQERWRSVWTACGEASAQEPR